MVIASHPEPSPKATSKVSKTQSTRDLIDRSTHSGPNKNVCSRSPLLKESAGCVSSRFQFSVLSLISHSGISSSSTVCYCKAAVALSAVSTCTRVCACFTVRSRLGRVLVYLLQHLCLSVRLCQFPFVCRCVCVFLMLSVGVNLYLF